ncbi:MAG: phage holin family protein [Balneolaceae bacterium]|nr:phage holin family protein [Balneolaceae bacterium]
MSGRDSDQLGQRFKAISSDLKLYIEKRVELFLLNIGEHMSRLMAESIQKTAGILMLFGGLVCLVVALAIYLGNILDNESLGYIIVSLPLLVIGLLFFYLKPDSLRQSIQDHFESEFIKALNSSDKKEQLNLPEASQEEKP